ncbi:MAG TPA: pitrilysin family protein [Methylomirabilota bacterium]|nr:pitrilysin family protein [Methylomirabilota bacterium]
MRHSHFVPLAVLSCLLLFGILFFSLSLAADQVLEATLPNGLKLLLSEDHRSPIVTVQIWYRVANRNEQLGKTGLSHLLEHMMFKGTARFGPGAYAKIVEQNGGNDNAFTSQDHTGYFVNIAADKLDIVLDLEADRMQHLTLDAKEFESEREVVIEERRTRSEDNPVGALVEELNAMAFKAHPYGWPIIGWMEDIRRLTVEDLRDYYRTYYRPNNAVMVIVGDFSVQAVLKKVEEKFGAIPKAPEPPQVRSVEPEQRGERRVVLRREAELPFVFYGYLTPNYRSQDSYALELLSTVLSGGRASRLYRRLVYEQQLALDAGGDYTQLAADPDLFTFYAQVMPEKSVEEVERTLSAEVEKLRSELVDELELARAKNQLEAAFLFGQDSIFQRARILMRYELAGGWRLRDAYLPGIRAVTREDIRRVAQSYFTPDRRNVAILIPLKPGNAK